MISYQSLLLSTIVLNDSLSGRDLKSKTRVLQKGLLQGSQPDQMV